MLLARILVVTLFAILTRATAVQADYLYTYTGYYFEPMATFLHPSPDPNTGDRKSVV